MGPVFVSQIITLDIIVDLTFVTVKEMDILL